MLIVPGLKAPQIQELGADYLEIEPCVLLGLAGIWAQTR